MRAYDRDFHAVQAAIDLAASHVHEALCELHETRGRFVPLRHRELINAARRSIESALDSLRRITEEDRCQEQQPKPKQLPLL